MENLNKRVQKRVRDVSWDKERQKQRNREWESVFSQKLQIKITSCSSYWRSQAIKRDYKLWSDKWISYLSSLLGCTTEAGRFDDSIKMFEKLSAPSGERSVKIIKYRRGKKKHHCTQLSSELLPYHTHTAPWMCAFGTFRFNLASNPSLRTLLLNWNN